MASGRDHFRKFEPLCRSNTCGNWGADEHGRVGCLLHPRCPSKIDSHLMAGGGCLSDEPLFPASGFESVRAKIDRMPVIPAPHDVSETVRLVTVHYNPLRFKSLAETFDRWLPTLGPLQDRLYVYELVFDDDEPELQHENHVVIRGRRDKHLMWQKEALINRALRDCPPNIDYFGWMDHDICLSNPRWLRESIYKIKADDAVKAVQCFSSVMYLDAADVVDVKIHGRVANVEKGNPGGVWLADRHFLDQAGGLVDDNVCGGGDVPFLGYFGWESYVEQYLRKNTSPMAESNRRQIERVRALGAKCCYVDGLGWHLHHAHTKHRQYDSRVKILNRHRFDPATDIRVNEDGILEWSSDKPELHAEIRQFFVNRRDDEKYYVRP